MGDFLLSECSVYMSVANCNESKFFKIFPSSGFEQFRLHFEGEAAKHVVGGADLRFKVKKTFFVVIGGGTK